jgi:hypothetical protein
VSCVQVGGWAVSIAQGRRDAVKCSAQGPRYSRHAGTPAGETRDKAAGCCQLSMVVWVWAWAWACIPPPSSRASYTLYTSIVRHTRLQFGLFQHQLPGIALGHKHGGRQTRLNFGSEAHQHSYKHRVNAAAPPPCMQNVPVPDAA